jgi:hypothetical protein
MLLTSRGHFPLAEGDDVSKKNFCDHLRRSARPERSSWFGRRSNSFSGFPLDVATMRNSNPDSVEGKSRKRTRRGRTHMRTGRSV